MSEMQRLYRSERNRLIAGVCGGLGEFLGLDPTIIRVVFVVLTFFGGAGLWLYLAMWLIVPRASKVQAPPRDVVRDAVSEARDTASDAARSVRDAFSRRDGPPEGPPTN